MNKLNNFFSNWKGSNLFLSTFIGLSVITSTAAASGGIKNFSFFNSGTKTEGNAGQVLGATVQAQTNTEPQISADSALTQTEPQVSAPAPVIINVKKVSTGGGTIKTQTYNQTAADLSGTSDTIDVQATATSADTYSTTTSTDQSSVTLKTFNPQTLALHKQTGDCYVA